MDEHSVSSLNETGTVRLLSLLGNSLAAVCVLAAVGGGCTFPSATDHRDGIASGSFSAEPSAPTAPRFAAGGPDAEEYGASEGYPIGDRSTFASRSSSAPTVISTRSSKAGSFAAPPRRRGSARAAPSRRSATSLAARPARSTTTSRATRPPGSSSRAATRSSSSATSTRRNDRHRFTSFSMAKTVTAMLVGIAIAEGRIRSVDDPAAAYVPALAGTEYGRTSLRHLLQMSSGVRFVEEYTGQDDVVAALRRHVHAARRRRRRGGEAVQRAGRAERHQVLLRLRRDPGARPRADAARSGGRSPTTCRRRSGQPIGAEADATWLIDRSGQEVTYCCLNAVLRDYARLGLLLAHDGNWRGRQIIPAAWIEDATRRALRTSHICGPASRRHFSGTAIRPGSCPGERRMFAFLGVRGQAIFVDPASRLVMVHTAVRKQWVGPGVREATALWQSIVRELGG